MSKLKPIMNCLSTVLQPKFKFHHFNWCGWNMSSDNVKHKNTTTTYAQIHLSIFPFDESPSSFEQLVKALTEQNDACCDFTVMHSVYQFQNQLAHMKAYKLAVAKCLVAVGHHCCF